MSELEERLRAGFRARAAEISAPVPPLELQPGVAGGTGRGRVRGVRSLTQTRWLAPAGAAVVVLAVIAGSLAASRMSPAPRRRPPAVAPVQLSIPRYYVALDSRRPVSSFPEPVAVATVRVTTTGAAIARITPPSPYSGFTAVSGAADDRTFVLLARAPTDPFTGVTPERFFVLRIDPGAASAARARLTPLPPDDIPGGTTSRDLPLGEQVGTMALSPDGSSLAAILTVRGPPRPGNHQILGAQNYLYVDNLATGTARVWIRKTCGRCKPTALGNELGLAFERPGLPTLSWTQDGKSLAFISGPGMTQVRVLHLGARGDNVQPNSTPFLIHAPVSTWTQAVMTPDGRTVFLTFRFAHGYRGYGVSTSLMRFSSATGQLATINTLPLVDVNLHATEYASGGPLSADTILWTNYNGSKVIIADAAAGHTLGVYSGGTYTPLPWSASTVDAAW